MQIKREEGAIDEYGKNNKPRKALFLGIVPDFHMFSLFSQLYFPLAYR